VLQILNFQRNVGSRGEDLWFCFPLSQWIRYISSVQLWLTRIEVNGEIRVEI
jgi:hypothetical protein